MFSLLSFVKQSLRPKRTNIQEPPLSSREQSIVAWVHELAHMVPQCLQIPACILQFKSDASEAQTTEFTTAEHKHLLSSSQ